MCSICNSLIKLLLIVHEIPKVEHYVHWTSKLIFLCINDIHFRFTITYIVTLFHTLSHSIFTVSKTATAYDGLMQERRNSIANAVELLLSFTNPSIESYILFDVIKFHKNTSPSTGVTSQHDVSAALRPGSKLHTNDGKAKDYIFSTNFHTICKCLICPRVSATDKWIVVNSLRLSDTHMRQ